MLVPLVDMLNHAGDVEVSASGVQPPTVRAFENVRWDLRAAAPGGGDSGWTMVVSATRAIAAGEELLLSYGAPAPPFGPALQGKARRGDACQATPAHR